MNPCGDDGPMYMDDGSTWKDPPMAYNPSIPFDWMIAHNPSIPLKWMMAFPSTTLCSQLIIHTSLLHWMMVLVRTTYDHNSSIPFSMDDGFLSQALPYAPNSSSIHLFFIG